MRAAYHRYYADNEVPPDFLGSFPPPCMLHPALKCHCRGFHMPCSPHALKVSESCAGSWCHSTAGILQGAGMTLLGVTLTEVQDQLKGLVRASAEGPSHGSRREGRRKKAHRAAQEEDEVPRCQRHRPQVIWSLCL